MEWLIANWWLVYTVIVPFAIGGLKYTAHNTKWVWDDKIMTLICGWWDMTKGQMPRNTTNNKK